MLKKTIKYTDYDGNTREEDFYFYLSKAELMEMQLEVKGGLTEYIKKIVAEQDVPKIVKYFKELILKSYGEKSADGKHFVKNDEIREAFTQTEAFSNLYVELATDASKGAAFINSIIPADLAKEVEKEVAKDPQLAQLKVENNSKEQIEENK